MRILPVLDLLHGEVVRGVAGRRDEYRPLVSRLVDSAAPHDVARALRHEFGFSRLYLADLDGILSARPNWTTIEQLVADEFKLLVDAGCRDVETAARLNNLGCEVVIGLESSPTPEHVTRFMTVTREITFSVDLKAGLPMLAEEACGWRNDPHEIVRQIVDMGISRLIVLDLADVGMGSGARTASLCESLLDEFPTLHLTCGGGVRNSDDLRSWSRLGAQQVLVASTLHDGRLTARDLAEWDAN